MKKYTRFLFITAIVWLTCGSYCQLHADNRLSIFDIPLSNGETMRIQVCSNEIFRIRFSSTGKFQETLMERYGIIKTEWEPTEVTHKREREKHLISTSSYRLIVDPVTGDMTLHDNRGREVVKKIQRMKPEERITGELGASLRSYFEEMGQEKAIIGSEKTDAPVNMEASDEAGNPAQTGIISISLDEKERFYGGGSASRSNIQHRGTALRMWATYQKAENPTPFIISSGGWGIFNNTTVKNYFDIGRFQKEKLYIYNSEGAPDFYLFLGKEMSDVIDLYTQVTGRPYLLPKWAYGLAFGGNQMENQFDIMNDALRFREEQIPCDIFWLEPQWMEKRYDFSTSKNWNFDRFPAEPFWEKKMFPKYEHPSLFISRLHGLGFKLALWLCIDHDMSIAEEDRLAEKQKAPLSNKEH